MFGSKEVVRERERARKKLTFNQTFTKGGKVASQLVRECACKVRRHHVYAQVWLSVRSVTTSEQSVVICTATYPRNTFALTFDNAISFPWKSLLLPRLGKRCPVENLILTAPAFPPFSCRFPRPQTLLKRNFLSEKLTLLFCTPTISFKYGEIVSLLLCPVRKTVLFCRLGVSAGEGFRNANPVEWDHFRLFPSLLRMQLYKC